MEFLLAIIIATKHIYKMSIEENHETYIMQYSLCILWNINFHLVGEVWSANEKALPTGEGR